MSNLREHPDVQELIDTLDKNGLEKEKAEVVSLADYIVDMENTLSGMLKEMQAMRNEVNLIHNSTLRARCGRLVDKAENSIKQAFGVIRSVKDKFVESAKSALQTFKEKGKEALQKAVNGMKIPETLDKLKSFFQRVSKSLEQDAKQIDLMRSELNKSKTHFKNFGRALFGREVKEAEYVKRDKGLLSTFRKGYEKLSKSFANMSQKASDLADKLRYEKIKSSVKKDLDFLQGKSDNHSKSAPVIEHSR